MRVLDELREEHPQLEICVPAGALTELELLTTRGPGKQKRAAQLAKQLISQQDLKVVSHSEDHVDDALLALAADDDVLVTLDKELIARARKQRLRVLTLANRRLSFVA